MDQEEENHAAEEDLSYAEEKSSNGKKRRGPSLLFDIIHGRSTGARMEVTYNKKGQPILLGAKKLATFIGVLARTTVPIIYEAWPDVPGSLKEIIWSMVQKSFIVDPRSKKQVFSSAGKKWKSFKSTLTTRYILKYKHRRNLLKIKPKKYEFITQPQWDAFVKSRLTQDFLETHEEHSRRRALHEYNHRMSRLGYANLNEELKLELGIEEDIERGILWKKGHADKEGNYLNDATKQCAEKIDIITQEVREGKLSCVGRNDILTQALETPKPPGRVRGAGQFVTHKVYFNTPTYKPATKTQKLEQQLELVQNQVNMFVSLLEPEKFDPAKLSTLQGMFISNNRSEKVGGSMDQEKTESSKRKVSKVESKNETKKKDTGKKCREKEDISFPTDSMRESKKAKQQDKEGPVVSEVAALKDDKELASTKKAYIHTEKINEKKRKKCKLAVDTKDNIVAMGILIMLDGPIHGVPIGADNVRISVDVPIKDDAYLPIPNAAADIYTVRQAIGAHVAWPRHLVLMSHEETSTSIKKFVTKTSCGIAAYKMPKSVLLLLRFAKSMDKSSVITVPMEDGVFGNLHNNYIDSNDIIQFCVMHPISTACISSYMRHLWSLLKVNNGDNLYAFVDPGRISSEAGKVEARSRALSTRFECAHIDQFIIAPYNTGNHWLLAAINPYTALVYYFDPLGYDVINLGMKAIIETAIKMFNAQKGRKNRKAFSWEVVKCPRQPGSVECGYYIMKYMKEIIGTPSNSILNMFDGKETYTQEEIDVVRVEWADQVEGYIQEEDV